MVTMLAPSAEGVLDQCAMLNFKLLANINNKPVTRHAIPLGHFIMTNEEQTWLIDWCLMSSEQFVSYIQDENI
jgi:hypothetical protein